MNKIDEPIITIDLNFAESVLISPKTNKKNKEYKKLMK